MFFIFIFIFIYIFFLDTLGPQQGRLTGIVKCNLNDITEIIGKEIEEKGDVEDGINLDSSVPSSSSSSSFQIFDTFSNNGDYSLILDLLGNFTLPSVKIDKNIFIATDISRPTLIPNQNRIILKTQAGLLFNKEKAG